MHERITFISYFNDSNLEKIKSYTKLLNDKLCKIPYGVNVYNRDKADTLPYHFTFSVWNIEDIDKIVTELSKIEFHKLRIFINNIEIMEGKEDSYILYFNIEKNEELKLFQEKI